MFDPSNPTLKAKLAAREPVGLSWFSLGNVAMIEWALAGGAEAVTIDMQHGLFDRLALEAAMAVVPPGVPGLVRVEDDSASAIARGLDCGAEGIIVPLIESAEQGARAVAAAHFPPKGVRSGGGLRPLRQPGYMQKAGDAIAVGLMVETRAGVENAAAIASVPGADFVFIGTGDLALSLGVAPGSAAHSEACASVLAACRKARVPCGIFTLDADAAAARITEGYAMVVVANDVTVVGRGFADAASRYAAARPKRRRRAR